MATNTPLENFFERIGKRVSKARKEKDEKLVTAARGLNISLGHMSEIENGIYDSISLHLIADMAVYYSIPFDDPIAADAIDKDNQNDKIIIDLLLKENKMLKEIIEKLETKNSKMSYMMGGGDF